MKCFADVQKFFQSTLLYVQQDHTLLDRKCACAITKLVSMGYLTLEPINGEVRESQYLITSLGRAAFKGQYITLYSKLESFNCVYIYKFIYIYIIIYNYVCI